ncbi:MAG TPA: IS1634 family transposase [Candidatus Polarisedimenticolaceae bacterium]|nr:IS1634 family transposase [Candidatus Polarisedimenticolaceae bacterium]
MAARIGAVHVATTRRRYKGKLYESHLLRRTYREAGKVKHQTLGNISHLPEAVIEMVRAALRGEHFVPAAASLQILRSLPHGHVAAVVGSLRGLGLETWLGSRPSRQRDLVVAMIAARVIGPASKLATARGLSAETACMSLGGWLGLGAVDEEELYGAMDWLLEKQPRLEGQLAERHLNEGALVLYDVSSSYYTGTHCSLAKFGHSHDGKRDFPQILYGLLCNDEGCPVAVEIFEGNVGEPKTLRVQIQKVRQRFGLRRVVWVGDRGMITGARIREELEPAGLDWITALRAPAIRQLAEAGLVQPSLFDERDLAEIHSPDYPGERLIACRNPFLAAERAHKREELLKATEREIEGIARATRRPKRSLRGADRIGLRVGKVINRYKMEKHFRLTITDTSFSYERDREHIAAEAALDGIYIIRTSVSEDVYNAPQTVRAYKNLSRVERAFRCLKTVDLKVRPIHHRLAERVRAHVFLCMLAYYVEWHMRRVLASMLFDDEDRQAAEASRRSVVAPAVRSAKAEAKASTKRTDEGQPVHSFRTLLEDLATITKNRVRPRGAQTAAAEFDLVTTPTPLQQRALSLLGVSLGP